MKKGILHALFYAYLTSSLVACSTLSVFGIGETDYPASELDGIQLIRENGVNNNRYILVDIVFIYKAELVNPLLPPDANSWFKLRETFLAMDKRNIEIISHQPVPLSIIDNVSMPTNDKKAERVLVYAAYYAKNQYFSTDISQFQQIKLELLEDQLKVIDSNKNE